MGWCPVARTTSSVPTNCTFGSLATGKESLMLVRGNAIAIFMKAAELENSTLSAKASWSTPGVGNHTERPSSLAPAHSNCSIITFAIMATYGPMYYLHLIVLLCIRITESHSLKAASKKSLISCLCCAWSCQSVWCSVKARGSSSSPYFQ